MQRDGEQGQVGEHHLVVDRAQQREQVEAGVRSGVIGQVEGLDPDATAREDRAQLFDARLVRAKAAADGEGRGIEPEHVAGLAEAGAAISPRSVMPCSA